MQLRIASITRVLGFVLGGAVAVSAAIVLVVWVSFDAVRTAGVLGQYFRDQYQRTLRVGQAPRLLMRPWPVLELRQVTLSEPGRNDAFATAGRVRLRFALLPLLLQKPVVRSIQFDALEANLVRNRDGAWSSADLLAHGQALQDLPWQSQLEGLNLAHSKIKIDDQAAGLQYALRDLSFDTDSLQNGLPGAFSAATTLHAEDGQGSEVQLSAQGRYVLKDALTAGRLDALSVSADGDVGAIKGATGKLVVTGLIWQDGFRHADLAGATMRLRGAQGDQSLEFSAEAPALSWQGLATAGRELHAQWVSRRLEHELRVDVNLPQLTQASSGFVSEGASAHLQYKAGKHSVDVSGSAQAAVDFAQGEVQAKALTSRLAWQSPLLRDGKLALTLDGQASARLAGSNTPASADGLFNLHNGDDLLTVNARAQRAAPAPWQISVQGNAPRWDVDRVLSAASVKQLLVQGLASMTSLNASGSLSAARLKLQGTHLSAVKLSFKAERGQLHVAPLTFSVADGSFAGELNAEAASARWSLKGDFDHLALARLYKELAWQGPLSGELGGSCAINAVLRADQPMADSLQGALRWTVRNASLQGADLARSLREFRPAIGAGKATARTPQAGEATALGSVASRFVFDAGKAKAEAIEAHADWLDLAGAGVVDLKAGEQDFDLQANLSAKVANTAARDLADLRGKPLGLHLKGPMTKPDVRFEPINPPAAPVVAAKARKK